MILNDIPTHSDVIKFVDQFDSLWYKIHEREIQNVSYETTWFPFE